jgi:hypothetical protein
MRRFTWLFAPFALLGLAWMLNVSRASGLSFMRGWGIGLALATLVWSVWMAPKRTPAPAVRLLFCVATAALFWICVLDWRLAQAKVLALGFLSMWTACVIHATLLWILTRAAGSETRPGGLLLKLALSVCALFASLTAAEAVLRWVYPLPLYGIFPDDPQWGPWSDVVDGRVVPRPGFKGEFRHPEFNGSRVEINALGLRDGLDEETSPAPGEASVLAVGDSFTFGTGVALSESFHELLEVRAAEITSKPLRVYGGGVPGYGTTFEHLRLIELLPKTKPDVVILGFFEGNDMQDNVREAHPAGLNDEVNDETERLRGSLLRRFLQDIRRAQYWTTTSALARRTGLDRILAALGGPSAPTNLFLEDGLKTPLPEWIQHTRDAVLEELGKLRQSCAENEAELVILIIPDVIVAEPDRFADFVSKQPASDRKTYSRTALHDEFVALLQQGGFTVVDMLATLERENASGQACYLREGHWNAHGHALAADRLVPVLAGLLEP